MVRFYREGIMKNIVPLMLCISIVTSCMFVYSKNYLFLFVLITVLIQASVFSFYTFLSKKSMVLRFISILGSFFAIGGMVTIAIKTGNNKDSLDYFVWFLSPQALVDFSPAYIAATFIIINFFIASTVYYFSAVRYRISMTFLITLIPFAVYRKEGEQVPVFFALLLLVMYMALMIHCRQINQKPRQKFIVDSGYKRSMAVFLAFTSLLALVLPKPDPKIDNSWVDTIFESERITEYMFRRLGIDETASSSTVYTGTSNMKLYEFTADEHPINLKSQVYSIYDYSTNTWRTTKDELTGPDITETDAAVLSPAEFYKAALTAAELDRDFAEKYSLSSGPEKVTDSGVSRITLIMSRIPSKIIYSPALAFSVSVGENMPEEVFRTNQGMLYSELQLTNAYSVSFYSDRALYGSGMAGMVKTLDISNFEEFMDELTDILDDNKITDYNKVTAAYKRDYNSAVRFLEETMPDLPESIYETAEKITRRKTSDLEKALAIEEYFRLNDYVYSLSYRKPDRFNMEYFLNEGKTGICTEYATAMVLLARAAGIPARYAEGIHLHDPDEYGVITVTDRDLHAFPELYISGYGWMSFEPTQLTSVDNRSGFDYRMSVVLALAALLIIIFVLFWDRIIYPYLSEKIFRMRLKKAGNEKAVEMIFRRIRSMPDFDSSFTSGEACRYVSEVYNIDMSGFVSDFDRAVYGGEKLGDEAKSAAVGLYDSLKEVQPRRSAFAGKKEKSNKNIAKEV